MNLRTILRDQQGIQQQIAAFFITVGLVLATETLLFYFVHAPHSRKRLAAEAKAVGIVDGRGGGESLPDDVNPEHVRIALKVLCAREAAQTAADNARTALIAAIVVLIPLCVGWGMLVWSGEVRRSGASAVAIEGAAVAFGTIVVLAVFHGMAADWRFWSSAEMVDDVARGYFQSIAANASSASPAAPLGYPKAKQL